MSELDKFSCFENSFLIFFIQEHVSQARKYFSVSFEAFSVMTKRLICLSLAVVFLTTVTPFMCNSLFHTDNIVPNLDISSPAVGEFF